LRCF
jgi:hypothetical protein